MDFNKTDASLDNTTSTESGVFPAFPYGEIKMAKWGWWTMQILTPVIVVVGIIGNILSFRVMKAKRLKNKSYSHLLCTLAFFDSLSLICRQLDVTNQLIGSQHDTDMFHNFSDDACKIYNFLEHMAYLMSAWLIVAMAIERLVVILFPFRKVILRTQCGAIFIVVLMFLILSLTQIFRFITIGNVNGACSALQEHLAMYTNLYIYLYQFSLIFALPFLIVITCNLIVIYQIHNIRKQAGSTSSSDRNTHKTTIMLLSISFAYVVFMLPLFTVSALVHSHIGSPEGIVLYYRLKPFTELFSVISYMNYGINFFIYILFGQSFRVELKRLFVKKRNLSITGTRTRTKEELLRLQ